eukprot:6758768-Pyramimonas_sp.AAC.1
MVPQGRLVGARVELPGLGAIGILSVYMQVSTSLNETHLNLLAATAILQHAYQIPVLAAGDYNMSPSKLQENGYRQHAGMQILHPSSPTCRTKTSQS